MITISFVIPVYRNEKSLTLTYKKIKSLFQTDLSQYQYEIFFIDDGSDDGSLNEILELRNNDLCVKAITFTRNFGQMAAMLAGFQKATGDVVINVSADLQDPIELVSQMIDHWKAGSEIVICHRTDRADTFTAKLFSKAAYGLLRLGVPKLPAGGFDFVLMDRKVMDTFNSIDVRNRFFQGDLLWSGYRTSFIPYVRLERTIGKSQYNFWKRTKSLIDGMIDASYLPIRAISFLGMMTSLIGFLYGITVVGSWFFKATPFPGFAPLMIVFLSIGGLILMMLGVVGEYIWRIYEEVRKKPNFLIRDQFL